MPSLNLSLGRKPAATQIALCVLVALLLGVVYFVLLYSDVSGDIERQKRLSATYRTEVADLKRAEADYNKDLAELTQRQQRQQELNRALPSTAEAPSFLSALQAVANMSGVSLLGWAPREEIILSHFAKVPMHLQVSGKFHQIVKFFYGVGQLDRIINIENIDLSVARRPGNDAELHVECLATAFRAVAASSKPGPPPPGPGGK